MYYVSVICMQYASYVLYVLYVSVICMHHMYCINYVPVICIRHMYCMYYVPDICVHHMYCMYYVSVICMHHMYCMYYVSVISMHHMYCMYLCTCAMNSYVLVDPSSRSVYELSILSPSLYQARVAGGFPPSELQDRDTLDPFFIGSPGVYPVITGCPGGSRNM